VAIVNPGMIVASGGWNQSSGEIFHIFENNRFTFSGGSAYVDVRDVAKIAVELMERNIFGERFIAVSENKRYAEIGAQIRKKLGLNAPKILSRIQLNFGRLANTLFGWMIPKLRIITKSNIESVS